MSPRLARYLEIVQHSRDLPHGMVSAFAACFSWQEACEALTHLIDGPYEARSPVQRRIIRLAENSPDHAILEEITLGLLTIAEDRIRLRRRVGSILWSLFPHLPFSTQKTVADYWKASRTVDSQDRWLKVVNEFPTFFVPDEVFDLWVSTRHYGAAKVLAYKASPEFLGQILDDLIEHCSEGWVVSRAALRSSSLSERHLRRIKVRFPVSFAYICAKIGRPITEQFVMQTFINEGPNPLDSGRPLLLWSVGQLGMWNTLEKICRRWPEISEREIEMWVGDRSLGVAEVSALPTAAVD